MTTRPRFLELRCGACLWRETCGPAEMVQWLRKAGKVREGMDMEREILYEVFRASAGQFECPKCGRTGLSASNAAESGDWPGGPECVKCGLAIGRERAEALPGARVCAACQQATERGAARPDQDFCPRCGAKLEIRVVTQGNRTRYVLACSANPPCPL